MQPLNEGCGEDSAAEARQRPSAQFWTEKTDIDPVCKFTL
jgi:hypothetical protein